MVENSKFIGIQLNFKINFEVVKFSILILQEYSKYAFCFASCSSIWKCFEVLELLSLFEFTSFFEKAKIAKGLNQIEEVMDDTMTNKIHEGEEEMQQNGGIEAKQE